MATYKGEPMFAGADVSGRNYILFDFDGTLGDTTESLVARHSLALLKYGFKEEELGDVSRLAGPPSPGGYIEFYGIEGEENIERIVACYAEANEELGPETIELFEGVPEMLGRLKDAGKVLVVATSRHEEEVDFMLNDNNIRHFFDHICGQFDPNNTSKVAIMEHALELLGITSEDAVVVGDRFYDVVGAHGNNLPCVGVTYGLGGTTELEEAGCDIFVDSVPGVADLLIGE